MVHLISPEAEADLDSIWYYIATQSGNIDLADRFVESLTENFYLLARNPYLGRRRDEDLRPGLRSLPAGDYVIIYRIAGDGVLILKVVRGSRDFKALFR